MPHSALRSALLCAILLTGCADLAKEGLNVLKSGALQQQLPAGNKARLNGRIYAPADQLSAIAFGGANYVVAARSDEKGVAKAKVRVSELGGASTAYSAETDTTGKFTLDLPASAAYDVAYVVTANADAKDGKKITLSGLAFVGASSADFELDVAHHLVAAKLLKGGLKKIEAEKLKAAVDQMSDDLSSVSKAPMPVDRAGAASEFDKLAGSQSKKLVSELLK